MLWLIALLLAAALLIGGLLGKMAVNGGCDSHHWGEYEDTDNLRGSINLKDTSREPFGRPPRIRFRVDRQRVAQCVHDGCDAETEKWKTAMNFTKTL